MERHEIQPSVFLFAAMTLLVVPLRWIFAALVASCVHEFGHILAVALCGGKIGRFSITPTGARLCADGLSPGKRLICLLAGPIGGLLLLLLYRSFPRVAICALVQSVYNLLPLEPLDGGRALRLLCTMLFSPKTANRICCFLRRGCIFVLLGTAAALLLFLRVGFLGVLPLGMAVFRSISEKDLAKDGFRQYNR